MPDCFYLMGTVDPTGCLEKDQDCIIHEHDQITRDVLVYRNPDEIARGDFDGDLYWVPKYPQILQYFRKSDSWMENSGPCQSVQLDSSVKKPSTLSTTELEDELFRLFLKIRFQPSNAMGVAADSWMALMDRLLTLKNYCSEENEKGKENLKENILKLIDIYYEALDAPKKGGKQVQVPDDLKAEMFPYYMERDKSFTSTSILGLIYDWVGTWQTKDIEDYFFRAYDFGKEGKGEVRPNRDRGSEAERCDRRSRTVRQGGSEAEQREGIEAERCERRSQTVSQGGSIDRTVFRREEGSRGYRTVFSGSRLGYQKGVIYLDLVCVFYFNLRMRDGVAKTKVKGVNIILDDDIWAIVAMLPIRDDSVKIHLGIEGFNRLLAFQSFLRNPQLQIGHKQLLVGGFKVDPLEKLDHEVADILVDIAENFLESIIRSGCSLAKHRKSTTLEAKDILLHLEKNWNMTLPGFGGDEIKSYRRQITSDIHKERLSAIKKSVTATEAAHAKGAGQASGSAKGNQAKTPMNIIGSPNLKSS
ncbi:hypothetical protein LR48_Vigan02g068600 [Vigna angularis]|uniref:RNA-dependent RNA polymerase n=1 Tax=Phaseolus angularis TaxID=3914 RepID=A0A0L9TVN2_PHAAN|nr:hypothetical protein LR48_Vigan02g068600 [Vigna angularis]